MGSRSPSESYRASSGRPDHTAFDRATTNGSSLEVCSPTAYPLAKQRLSFARGCRPRAPASSGFLDLVTPSSAPRLLALFHARSAHGVCPSELCSSRAAVRRLRRLLPSCRWPPCSRAPAGTQAVARAETQAPTPTPSRGGATRRPTSGPCSTRESATQSRRIRPATSA
jgi:hypothetical protein